MPHTLRVSGIVRSVVTAFACGGLSALSFSSPVPAWQTAVDRAARIAPESRILVLDIATGRLIASSHLNESLHTLAAPGSTLKPLALYSLVSAGRWDPDRRIACNRKLVVAGHRLSCTHPQAPPFDAREALSWSCNSYFAQLASTIAPGTLGPLLRPTGLLSMTGLAGKDAQSEATAEFHEPTNGESLQLALLGVDGIRVTPLELAVAYRWLALQRAAHPDAQASRVVGTAIENSATFGMARQAGRGGVTVAGKTGTAEGTASTQSHGWFAGMAPAGKPQVVLVVYLPAGHGGDAARVAAELLANSPLRKP